MPSYTYTTDDGEEVTQVQSIHDPLPDVIQLADGRLARRRIEWSGSVRLRGTGWASKPERDAANRKKGPQ